MKTLLSLEAFFVTLLMSYFMWNMGTFFFVVSVGGLSVVTFLLYVSIVKLQDLKDLGKLTWKHWAFGIPLVIVGVILDVILNVVLGGILFREFPREWLFTARLDRHGRNGSKLAQYICRYILNRFDDDHCYDGR